MTSFTASVLMCSSYTDRHYIKVVPMYRQYCKTFLHFV